VSSVFRFAVVDDADVLEDFPADPRGIADAVAFEQHGVTPAITAGVTFGPEAWTRHCRLHGACCRLRCAGS
jgi:hypothetical protein